MLQQNICNGIWIFYLSAKLEGKNGHCQTSTKDAEEVFGELFWLKLTITNKEIEETEIDLPKPSGRKVQLLEEKTYMARRIKSARNTKSQDIQK